ncbi:hypothetical protein N7533_001492 [Penicillium manginii]|uniref:uncharacterized protein n=1 Tax=Penicillium manginii TaxID=203109 RepID=UPI00254694F0|nr:uncharacterized protein N7533_001492 [Penicillium manginii]KAJ5762811.1 hypothetical protein N7533_001492 [Penicillium manginii]
MLLFSQFFLNCFSGSAAYPQTLGIVLIYVLLPFTYTEFAPPEKRAMQANNSVTPEELVAFKILRDHDAASKATPSLLAYQETTQSANMPVPGGFLTYVVWKKVSGIQLGDNTGAATSFWKSFPKKEDRDPIQKAFMRNFKYVISLLLGTRSTLTGNN